MERGSDHGPSDTKTEQLPPVHSEAVPSNPSKATFCAKLARHKWAIIAMVGMLVAALVTGLAVGLTRGHRGASLPMIGTAMGLAAPVPAWHIQSTAQAGNDLSALSKPGADVSSWYQIEVSKCTLMACLIHAGVYNDTDLFFSDNLKKVDSSRFAVPWIYRQEFSLDSAAVASGSGNHFFLQTQGITSKGDVWFNGHQLADKTQHAGSYVGRRFDITNLVATNNVLAIRVYPTNYNYDFALGFVDWNPYPADNGTGIWRDVTVHQTRGASITDFRLATAMASPSGQGGANVTLKATVTNLNKERTTVDVQGLVACNSTKGNQYKAQQSLDIGPLESREVSLTIAMQDAQIWWPSLWGAQPLYSARLSLSVNSELSDSSERTFGIRSVTSQVNKYNDTIFSINGQPFQVVGGGYSADMFLRWDPAKFEAQARYMLDLGHNTVRLEGKQEHPELYEIADRLGLMVMAGWECCDKWEAWEYNKDIAIQPPPVYSDADYEIASASMRHEAMMMQSHPSMLTFLVGSDYWPNDRATKLYVDALKAADWQMPIIASASKRGYPKLLGPSGMKMEGPYDWVPPNYWYDTDDSKNRKGAAFGFGSELGAGVGTPEKGSLRKFLSQKDMDDLWKEPKKGLYHMSNEGSQFFTREIYNEALVKRQGGGGGGNGGTSVLADSLDDYLIKAQMMDYEATRAEFEGFAARWNADRPATGLIYWMLNNAWPSLHWNLFDYYLHPAGSYFGAKVGARAEHVAYDYVKGAVYVINKSLDKRGTRNVDVQVMSLDGKAISTAAAKVATEPNKSKPVAALSSAVRGIKDVVLVRLRLADEKNATLSRNVYWLTNRTDTLDWSESTWYHTPVTKYADFTALNKMKTADLKVSTKASSENNGRTVVLENKATVPAVFVRLNLVDDKGADVNPVIWSDNYVTLWPGETLELDVTEGAEKGRSIEISGKNVAPTTVAFN